MLEEYARASVRRASGLVLVGHSEVIQFDGLSAFRRCGGDLVEFFNNTGWAFFVQLDYF